MSSPSGGAATSPAPGAQGTTPGSGKRKNRKKNSPRNKQGGDQHVGKVQAASEKPMMPSKLDILVSGASCPAPIVNLTTCTRSDSKSGQSQSKPNFIAELRAESDQILKEQAVCPPEKIKQKTQSGQTKGQGTQGQKKTPLATEGQAKSEGAQKKEGKTQKKDTQQGQKKADQDIKIEGQVQKKEGEAKKKVEGQKKPDGQGNDKGEGQPGDASQKSKAELKAERRAKQEAQRAAKEKKKPEGPGSSGAPSKKEVPRVPDNMKADVEGMRKKIVKKLERQQLPVRTVAQRKVRLFNHLHQYEREASLTQSLSFSCGGIHPAIVKLGLQYAEGIISGSNARCIGLLAAFKKVISDYTTPPHKELSRDLDARIKPYISFLTQCRPLSVSMGNAIKHIKWQITNTPADMSDMMAKTEILASIDNYWEEKIRLAGVAIANTTFEKIADGDVIVVYACSSLIRKVLCDAHDGGKKFRVIVVDGRPRLEGKEMLRRLVKAGIKCSYVLISAASYLMKEATKVLLGAHGLLANGFVMSRVGSSMIALIAKSFNVPVLVCCETYKFSKSVQTDSFVRNELGDPDDLVITGKKDPYLMDWRDYQSLSLLNLVYDVTPPEFISMVITEIGMIPCTSVPVVLRVKHLETNDM